MNDQNRMDCGGGVKQQSYLISIVHVLLQIALFDLVPWNRKRLQAWSISVFTQKSLYNMACHLTCLVSLPIVRRAWYHTVHIVTTTAAVCLLLRLTRRIYVEALVVPALSWDIGFSFFELWPKELYLDCIFTLFFSVYSADKRFW